MTLRKQFVNYFGWLIFVPLGSINLMTPELVDVSDKVYWRQLLSGVLGTYLWLLGGLWVMGYI